MDPLPSLRSPGMTARVPQPAFNASSTAANRMDRRGVEQRHGAVFILHKQHDLGAAENDRLAHRARSGGR